MEYSDLDSIDFFNALLRSTYRRTATRHDLPVVHGDILAYLSRCNGYSDTVLAAAEYLGLTKGTVSQSIKLLAERGYLGRVPDEKDRRVQHLVLTEKGLLYVADLKEDIQARLEGIEISSAYSRLFKTILGDLARQVQRRQAKSSAFGTCRSCRFHRPSDEEVGSCAKTGSLAEADMDKLCRLYSWAD